MRTFVILNPSAGPADGTANPSEIESSLEGLGEVHVETAGGAGDVIDLARRAIDDGYEMLVAAGGDGTVNQVVSALAESDGEAVLGVLPLGTANDFARSLGLPDQWRDAADTLQHGRVVSLDLVRARTGGGTRYCINVSAGGFSGHVDERLTDEMKRWWGPLAYVRSALDALPDLEDYETTIRIDDDEPESVDAFNVVVANGRYVAGGIPIAPEARLDDGLLDVVIVKTAALAELGGAAARILVGKHLDSPSVEFRRCRRIRLESRPGMWFNVDGELVGNEPIAFQVLAGAVRTVVGGDAAIGRP